MIQYGILSIKGKTSARLSITDFTKFLDTVDEWLHSSDPNRAFCIVLIADNTTRNVVYAEKPFGSKWEGERALRLFFADGRYEWVITASELVDVLKHTRDCIRATSKNAVAWETHEHGVAVIHFDVVESGIIQ